MLYAMTHAIGVHLSATKTLPIWYQTKIWQFRTAAHPRKIVFSEFPNYYGLIKYFPMWPIWSINAIEHMWQVVGLQESLNLQYHGYCTITTPTTVICIFEDDQFLKSAQKSSSAVRVNRKVPKKNIFIFGIKIHHKMLPGGGKSKFYEKCTCYITLTALTSTICDANNLGWFFTCLRACVWCP